MRVAIAGGGLIGLAVAVEAIARGWSVDVVDDDRSFAAYHASAGMLALPSEAQAIEPALVELARDSQRRYPAFIARVEAATGRSCGLAVAGSLYVALHRDQVAAMEHLQDAQTRLQMATERLTGPEVRDREPMLSPGVIAGLYAKDERQVDPRQLRGVLRAAVAACGGRIVLGEVVRLVGTRDRVHGLEVRRGPETVCLETDHTVVAAGAWSRTLLAPLLGEVPLRPVKGLTVRSKGKRLLDHVVRSPDVYLVPMADDELLIGASMEEVGFDSSINVGELTALLVSATRVLPGFKELELVGPAVGFRPVLRDGLPALGPTSIPGLHVAIGHSRHGVSLMPATAALVADGLADGEISGQYRAISGLRLEAMTA